MGMLRGFRSAGWLVVLAIGCYESHAGLLEASSPDRADGGCYCRLADGPAPAPTCWD